VLVLTNIPIISYRQSLINQLEYGLTYQLFLTTIGSFKMNATTNKAVADKAKNYSVEQEQIIRDSAPLNLAKAKVLAVQFGKSYQSIISKCGHLGVKYNTMPAPTKKPVKATKADVVRLIEKATDRDCDGLEKATMRALLNVFNGIQHLIPVVEDVKPPELSSNASIQPE
jgi:hypothetical protein